MLTLISTTNPEIGLTRAVLNQSGVLAAVMFGCVVLGVCGWLLAEALGWYRIPATLAAVGLSVAVALPLAQSGGHVSDPVLLCLRDQFSLHGGVQLTTFVLLMPFALCATLATRRPVIVATVSVMLAATTELIQACTGLGACQKQDFLNNSLGALVAVLAGWLVLVALGANGRGRRPAAG